ncbi:aldo/keto reductase [Pseudarthrobacter sp902506025]|uniref:Diketogulonate reductase-like aldo/keto reductase n=1 Tax=Pseudarthrobacter defluvii TaxID=410837 RepID=A0ABT9ULR9_9MICC|nr:MULTISPECIES: aldo/keto reductase [Micrococcaceae]MDQ0119199.1 diketogulonate reductase-like aldo/keto reductase [Pseudarthrobacter defluvii]WRT12066.1 aldo/keto reductase [Pseudarthrobacter sp. LT1]BCW78721.1 oxidoreductase [Arthrobacter sp. NicSoilC5]
MRTSPRLSLNNGVLIDQLGFGLYKVPAADAEGLVATALAAGYRHFDTAAMYGNETGVARGISSQLDAGTGSGGSGELFPSLTREDVFITTKVWNDHHGYDATLRAFDDSMVNLGLDYVDMYLIHWPCPRRGLFPETYRALETLYREGRVRAIGVSNFQPAHLDRLLQSAEVVPAVNQIELHPWLQQEELRSKHAELGIRTEAWSPLGRGQVLADPVIQACAAEHGRTPAQVILRWHMQLGHIAIPKASSEARIRENLDVFGFELSGRDLVAIKALDRGQRTGSHPDNVN